MKIISTRKLIRIILITTIYAVMICMSGCNSGNADNNDLESNEINVIVDISGAQDPIYCVDIEYFLSDDPIGGLSVADMKGAPLEKEVPFLLNDASFPKDSSLEHFYFVAYISCDIDAIDDWSLKYETNGCEDFCPEYGCCYKFRVTGDSNSGFVLEAV